MHTDPYDLWRRQRADATVPDGFADRVLDAVRDEAERPKPLGWGRLLASPAFRAAACVVAVLICLSRIGLIVAVFISH